MGASISLFVYIAAADSYLHSTRNSYWCQQNHCGKRLFTISVVWFVISFLCIRRYLLLLREKICLVVAYVHTLFLAGALFILYCWQEHCSYFIGGRQECVFFFLVYSWQHRFSIKVSNGACKQFILKKLFSRVSWPISYSPACKHSQWCWILNGHSPMDIKMDDGTRAVSFQVSQPMHFSILHLA